MIEKVKNTEIQAMIQASALSLQNKPEISAENLKKYLAMRLDAGSDAPLIALFDRIIDQINAGREVLSGSDPPDEEVAGEGGQLYVQTVTPPEYWICKGMFGDDYLWEKISRASDALAAATAAASSAAAAAASATAAENAKDAAESLAFFEMDFDHVSSSGGDYYTSTTRYAEFNSLSKNAPILAHIRLQTRDVNRVVAPASRQGNILMVLTAPNAISNTTVTLLKLKISDNAGYVKAEVVRKIVLPDDLGNSWISIALTPGDSAQGQEDYVTDVNWSDFTALAADKPILLRFPISSNSFTLTPASRQGNSLTVCYGVSGGVRLLDLYCLEGQTGKLEMSVTSDLTLPGAITSAVNAALPLEIALTAGDSALGQEDFVTLMSWSDFTALPADRQICLRFPYAGSQQTYAPASRQGNSLTVVFGVSGGIRLLDLYCVEGQSGKLELSVVTDLTLPGAITAAVNAAITAAIEGGY